MPGSICKRAGGGFFDAMRWPGKTLPIRERSIRPGVLPLLNSMLVPGLGSGDGLPRRLGIVGGSFVTAFKEQSTREKTRKNKSRSKNTWKVIRILTAWNEKYGKLIIRKDKQGQ
jgi:hypothetical protein